MDQFFYYFSGLALICFDPLLSVDVALGAAVLPSFVPLSARLWCVLWFGSWIRLLLDGVTSRVSPGWSSQNCMNSSSPPGWCPDAQKLLWWEKKVDLKEFFRSFRKRFLAKVPVTEAREHLHPTGKFHVRQNYCKICSAGLCLCEAKLKGGGAVRAEPSSLRNINPNPPLKIHFRLCRVGLQTVPQVRHELLYSNQANMRVQHSSAQHQTPLPPSLRHSRRQQPRSFWEADGAHVTTTSPRRHHDVTTIQNQFEFLNHRWKCSPSRLRCWLFFFLRFHGSCAVHWWLTGPECVF